MMRSKVTPEGFAAGAAGRFVARGGSAVRTGRADVGGLEGGGGMDPASFLGFSSVTEKFTTSVRLLPGLEARRCGPFPGAHHETLSKMRGTAHVPVAAAAAAGGATLSTRGWAGEQLAPKACNLGVRQIDQTFRGLTDRQR